MTATGIVALFSGLSAASSGAHHSLRGTLQMLAAMRYVPFPNFIFFCLDITHTFELLDSCSVLVSVLNTHAVQSQLLSRRKRRASRRMRKTDGLPLQRVMFFSELKLLPHLTLF